MVDKTDMAALLSALGRVCVEHEAMKTFLIHEYPGRWLHDVRTLAQGLGPRNRTADVFHEVNENLQSGQPADVLLPSLIDALDHVTLVENPPGKQKKAK